MSEFMRRDNETEEEFEERQRIGIDKDVPVDPNAPPVDPNTVDPTQSPTTLDPHAQPNFVPPEPHPTEVVEPVVEEEPQPELRDERSAIDEEDEDERRN